MTAQESVSKKAYTQEISSVFESPKPAAAKVVAPVIKATEVLKAPVVADTVSGDQEEEAGFIGKHIKKVE